MKSSKYIISSLLYRLYQSKVYWNMRKEVTKIIHSSHALRNKVMDIRWQEKGRNKAATALLKESLMLVMTSLLVVIVVLVVESIIYRYLNFPVADKLPIKILWMRDKYLLYSEGLSISSSYNDFMGVVAGIVALFIGLYYATISNISSAIYSKTTQQIRDIFSHETVGYTYLRSNTQLTIICLGFFIASTIRMGQSVIAIIIVGIWAAFAGVSFLLLGHRAFNFYDPAKLSGYIIADIMHCIYKCQVTSKRRNETVVLISSRKVEALIESLEELSLLVNNEMTMKSSSFAAIVRDTCGMIRWYQLLKRFIPYNSKWYPSKRIHKDWYQAESHNVDIAKQTSTTLIPEDVTDYYWLEDKLEIIVIQGFNTLLDHNKYNLASSILREADRYMTSLMKNALVERAMSFYERLCKTLMPHIKLESVDEKSNNIEMVAMLNQLVVLKTRLVTESIQHCKEHTYENYDKLLSSIKWNNSNSIYSGGFSFRLLNLASSISGKLKYELDVEGVILSPIWYLLQIFILDESRYIDCMIKTLITEEILRHDITYAELKRINNIQIKACFISEELEYWRKIDTALNALSVLWDDIDNHKCIYDLKWPIIDFDQVKLNLTTIKKRMMVEIAESLPIEHPDSLPDYLGQFLNVLGDHLILVMLNNDSNQFKAIFHKFFLFSLVKYDQLIVKIDFNSHYATIQFCKYASPLVELLELSGYAKLLSDFHEDSSIWNEVLSSWNEYFEKDTNKTHERIVSILNIVGKSMFFDDRSSFRNNWKSAIKQKLDTLPKQKSTSQDKYSLFSRTRYEVVHNRKIVKVVASSYDEHYDGYDGMDIMFVEYLEPRFKGIIDKLASRRMRRTKELYEELKGGKDADK